MGVLINTPDDTLAADVGDWIVVTDLGELMVMTHDDFVVKFEKIRSTRGMDEEDYL